MQSMNLINLKSCNGHPFSYENRWLVPLILNKPFPSYFSPATNSKKLMGGGGGGGSGGGGGGGDGGNNKKPEELQPHPVKEQLPGVQYCINSPPPWSSYSVFFSLPVFAACFFGCFPS